MDETLALDVHDPEACRAWARTVRPSVDAVLTIRELSVLPTAVIARELGLAGNAPEAVVRIRNKDECRRRLREAGLPQPATALCRSAAEAEDFIRRTPPGPWVVKPRDGLASIGVSRIDEPGRLPDALARFGAPPPAMGDLPLSPYFLVETYVSGDEYSAEGVVVGGVPQVLALTRKTVTDDFVELGQRVPSGLDEKTSGEAADAVSRALTAVGLTHGIFHAEFWVTRDGIVLGELHDRGGGDFIHALVEHTRPGLELYGTLIDDLLGRPPAPVPAPAGSARAEFLLAPPGTLRAVDGWDELAAHPAVQAAHLQVAPGDVIGQAKDSYTRSAVFVTRADDGPDRVDELTADLAARVTFRVTSETG
ncbi:ATP-grasp domain-containing protein [Streptomyces sp. XD-27]|uniref:ATP-grasp domain-containing protein n=1 Tax=Streptomyces sp. XD-27 TaxID=3062779 RepID=UPI0026F4594A|nr:ATP-grasp domain-containing protein [Streptomyces sp. XD-27]WKX74523.1 ATP-grasp domain-containing protein [Streptomyces sp. XD-27]